MVARTAAALLGATLLFLQCAPGPALAENQMGYQLLPADQAAGLPRRGGTLGMDVGRAQQIVDGGMTFELLRVKGVRQGSAAARAGFAVGDQVIAVDGRVFPSVAAFAAYVASMPPGQQISIDEMPAGAGPQQAQRVAVTLGMGARPAMGATNSPAPASTGMSTGTKVAIGAGAIALFGCYEMGCFSRSKAPASNAGAQQQQLQQQQPVPTPTLVPQQ